MINVLHVIDTGGPGGAETVFLNTCTGLEPRRFRSVCMVSRDGWLAESLRSRGVEPLIVNASGSLNFGYLRRILDVVRSQHIDVIAAHLYGSAIYCSLAGLIRRTPVVSILHGQSDLSKGGRLDVAKRLLVRRGSTSLVFVSEKLRQELAGALGVAAAKCRVIPNGVDMEKFAGAANTSIRDELGLQATDILVGAIGNIRRPKAYEVLLRAARLLRDRSERYRFVIAGEGGNSLHEELLALRSSLGLQDAVTFLGMRPDVARVLGNLNVYALSSNTEGFSIACVEAMAAGVPVVATRSGGPEEILQHEVTGLLVPVQDPESLAAGISRVAEDRPFASLLSKNALQRVRDRYTLRTMLDSYEKMFAGLAARDLRMPQ